MAAFTGIDDVPDLMGTEFGMLIFDTNSAPGYLQHVDSVAAISVQHATMMMNTACKSKTTTKVKTPKT
jgi:hypothetical protein